MKLLIWNNKRSWFFYHW